MNNNIDLFNKVINKRKYVILRNFLENNKEDILKLLQSKAKYKDIFETFKEISNIDIDYVRFCQILSEFKIKYIYSQKFKDITPKEIILTEQPKILAAEISETKHIEQQIQNKNETIKKEYSTNELQNIDSNIDKPKKLSRKERLLAIKNSEEKIIDIQKDQEKFVWIPNIKK